ncbi:hemerythrin domain-containing protein [Winogradskyella sp. DF17]|uniref:Hemerythrin domain-containing protein n=1 Tax=Winogradskyella pelagia TaxID=2819984 RepID=A0ABS3SZL8_9FLAO|nr:hemerythrin domain-containing protein [Winogradskyella sp. DF17]MBO3115920.1 hemerythrin domain-containing protein [Winogradskyella sp. DF17]
MPLKPLKRHKALQPLSREHHFGLLLCYKIRMGFRYHIAPIRIRTYASWFYKTHLIPHFEIEETHIFPVLGNDHELVKRALTEHKSIIQLFEKNNDDTVTLQHIEDQLEQHIRFEERVLFPEIQNVASEAEFLHIEKIHNSESFVENTTDVFWVK